MQVDVSGFRSRWSIWLSLGLIVCHGIATIARAAQPQGDHPTSSRYDSREFHNTPPPAPSEPRICTPSHTVLLIQDVVPWTASPTGSPLGALADELDAQHRNWCMISSSVLNFLPLNQFKEILIPSAQTQEFYDHLFPGHVIHSSIEEWVQTGGVLSANLADCGIDGAWAAGGCVVQGGESYTFIGGVKHVLSYMDDNVIRDPESPIISGNASCKGGHCKGIVDEGPFQDLDAWGASSHGYFTNLPYDTKVILAEGEGSHAPVFVEYRWGEGRVIASLATGEYRYVGGYGESLPKNKKLIANEIAYQNQLVTGGEKLFGHCKFEVTFPGGKSPYLMKCKASLKFRSGDGDSGKGNSDWKHSEGHFSLHCNDNTIYSEGLEITDQKESRIFSGIESQRPKIFVHDYESGSKSHGEDPQWVRSAVLDFDWNGYAYQIPGSCRFGASDAEELN